MKTFPSTRFQNRFGGVAIVVLSALLLACGSDSDSDTAAPASSESNSPAPSSSVETPPPSSVPTSTDGTGNGDLCALAQEIFEMDDFPSPEMLEHYRSMAPTEITGAVDLASQRLISAGDDLIGQFNVVGDDQVEAAFDEINEWEETNCGVPHSASTQLPPGASRDIDAAANRVDVSASDFEFATNTSEIPPGRTTFALTNEGVEAHFLGIVKLAEGATLAEFMASDDGTLAEGFWETGIAAGGGDEEVITFDVEAGNYAMVCFLPTTDGTPHAMLGMQLEFAVS